MTYSTVSLVWQHAPSINSVTALTSETIHSYIRGVDATIDAVISKRYSLPLSGSYPLLETLSVRESIYNIMVRRALIQFPPPQQGRHPLYQQHLDDQKLLEAIAGGSVQLVNTSGEILAASLETSDIYANNLDYHPTFHEGDVLDTIQDQEKLDDIKDERDL